MSNLSSIFGQVFNPAATSLFDGFTGIHEKWAVAKLIFIQEFVFRENCDFSNNISIVEPLKQGEIVFSLYQGFYKLNLYSLNTNSFATCYRIQNDTFCIIKQSNLKYQIFTISGFKDIGIISL